MPNYTDVLADDFEVPQASFSSVRTFMRTASLRNLGALIVFFSFLLGVTFGTARWYLPDFSLDPDNHSTPGHPNRTSGYELPLLATP